MSRKPIPVCEPHLWGNERAYVLEALDSGWISSSGKYLGAFETGFARYCGVEHGVAVANGTVALHAALVAAGVGPGDEVIVSDFTMISPVLAILYCGAKPVFVDATADTWTMDVTRVEAKITAKTRALLAVHIYGHPCDMEALAPIARRHNLVLIEDAAEAHGATVRGKRCGSLSDLACFSFYANKIITTGEGGMIVTPRADLAARVRDLRNLCFGAGAQRFVHTDVGFNYRMTNLQAALGLGQLEHIDAAVARKQQIAARYDALLADVPGLRRPTCASFATNVYWVYGVVLGPDVRSSRDALAATLAARGIETRPFFAGMHSQPLLAAHVGDETFPVSAELGARGLYLPSYMHLGDEDLEYVAATLRAVLAEAR